MIENLSLSEIKKNAYNSINQDGLAEIALGFMLLWLSVFLYLHVFKGEDVVVFLILPAILIGPFLQKMRKKFTYPRVGYANLVTPRRTKLVMFVLIIALALGIFAAVNYVKIDFHADIFYFAPLVIGLFLASAQAYRYKRYQTKRYFIYFLAGLISTITVYFFPMRGLLRVMIIFSSLGIFLIPIGLITFNKFNKNFPLQKDNSKKDEQ